MPPSARRSGSKGGSPATDRAALVALYKAARGDFWYGKYNGRPDDEYGASPYPTWLSAAALGRWHGVETNRAGRVTVLDLGYAIDDRFFPPPYEYSGVPNGSIPAELGNLDQLERLDLTGNWLEGPLPAELGNLNQLERIDLSRNCLYGSLPAELGDLGKLEWLDFSNNELSGSLPAELGKLGKLEWLDLSNNQLEGSLPAELGNLDKLRILDLSDNFLSGPLPAELSRLKLRVLNFSDNLDDKARTNRRHPSRD